MKKGFIILLLFFLLKAGVAIVVHFNRLPGGPPIQFEILVENDGEPPVEITDFHFAVTPPCMVVGAVPPPGWHNRYALPNTFVEMDANPGEAIAPGESGMFGVTLEGDCVGATFTFYLTSREGVIPGTEREGPIEGLSIGETGLPSKNRIQVFPNPFNSELRIVVDRARIANSSGIIEIADIRGRVVALLEVANSVGLEEIRWLPEGSVSSGVFLVRLRSTENGRMNSIAKAFYLK